MPAATSDTSKITDYDAATAFLGEWGPFQRRVVFLLCLSFIPNGLTALSVVFLADTPDHRCALPAHLNLSAAWRNSSIPLEEDANRDGALVPSKCSRYKVENLLNYSERGLLPGADVNLSNVPKEGCLDGWEFDHSVYTSTIVSEWDLVCDQSWKKPFTSSLFFGGILAGSFVSGQLSDRFGRKMVMFGTIGLQVVTTLIQIFSSSWIMFVVLYFLLAVEQISNYLVTFVLGGEILGPQVRTFFSTAGVCLFFAVGYTLLPLFAFFVRDWRMLQVGFMLAGSVCLPLFWFIPESPRWLLSQGRVEEAEVIIRNAAKMNRIESPPVIFSPLKNEGRTGETRVHNICDLLRSPNIRWLSVTLWLVWLFSSEFLQTYEAHSCNSSDKFWGLHLQKVFFKYSVLWCYTTGTYSVSLPYIIVGSLTVLTGLLSLLLPESFGMPLPDTISQMQRFPGCCQKRPYVLSNTEAEENAAEEKSPARQL
ncbi:solute carrier family 22 member 5-like [Poecilia formosa]|uniref:solute carrier family 22 member 5-like n=1 Tax=Poecilia formosa TaxID=48698 RepID=UPI0007BA4EFB|nr:PREDICTED: solute carrier family 22 member 5-like [Poecilia formosa]